ncbi:hypothetical protein FRC11_013182 [Ceratobasidium sp. 423]|nr:hypothetical protein FRC11_013182 [Ceratobasidium sp. 423]
MPRSVDVALQSLAAGDKKISPLMLERCDAWTLIRRRLESVDANGEQAEAVIALYKRALKSHVDMREGADGLRVIHKLLEQLSPLDQRRSVLERCTLIGPRLLEFECHAGRFGGRGAKTEQARTWWRDRPLEYNEATHQEHSESLAEAIIRLLEQGIGGETDMEPEILCILSASLVVLFCHKMEIEFNYNSSFVRYLQRSIKAYRLRTSSHIGDTRHRLQNSSVSNELHKSTIILLLGALPISYSPCSVEKSPCFFDSPSDEHMNSYPRSKKVLELVWKYLIGIVYSDTSSFNRVRYLTHTGLHLITRAKDYRLTPEDCMCIANLMGGVWPHPSEIDDSCLAHHIQEFSRALTPDLDLDALTPQLDACLMKFPTIFYGHEYLLPTPEFYVLTVNILCRKPQWGHWESTRLFFCFPFPKASPRLIDTLSKSGVFMHLVNSLQSDDRRHQAFAIAQLWLLFNMSIQASDRTSPALSKLEKLLLQYPRLKNNPENQEEVAEELELRLMVLMDEPWNDYEQRLYSNRIKYLHRVLECMLQQRYMPLPEKAYNELLEVPERLRGIASFVDLEAEASGPSSGNRASNVNPEPESGSEESG